MMKNYLKSLLIAAIAVVAALGFTACSNNDYEGDPYFKFDEVKNLENNVYTFDYNKVDTTTFSKAVKLTVRSNRPWKIVPQGDDSWLRVWPNEGDCDGYLRLSTLENTNPATREVTYKVYLDGSEYTTFTVKQTGCEPYIKPSANDITISRKGGEVQFSVLANVPYTYEVRPATEGEDVSWLSVKATEGSNTLVLSAGENPTSNQRKAVLHVQGTGDYTNLYIDVPVTQLGALFFDGFDWMQPDPAASILGWETTNELRFDKWSETMIAAGWVSRSTWCYGRPGFIKLGKTSYGGDVISPKIAEVQGTMNVNVSFQAVGYSSAGGTLDDRQLYVAIQGPGTIKSVKGGQGGEIINGISYVDANLSPITLSGVASIVLVAENHFSPTTDPEGLNIWKEDFTTYTIEVEGFTKDTQIIFLGGAYDINLKTVGSGKNRIFLDNFKVEEK